MLVGKRVGQDGDVPRYLRSPEALPETVEAAMTSFSLASQHALIRLLVRRGPSTSHQLAAELGAHVNSVLKRLRVLENEGLVVADIPDGQRHGHHVLYSIDQVRLEALIAAFAESLRGR